MQNISRENADIIGEVANICIGNAATTLSMILQKPTNITTPIVEVLKKEDALDHDDRILCTGVYDPAVSCDRILGLPRQPLCGAGGVHSGLPDGPAGRVCGPAL